MPDTALEIKGAKKKRHGLCPGGAYSSMEKGLELVRQVESIFVCFLPFGGSWGLNLGPVQC